MNGLTLKLIAVLSMLIDHMGYVLFPGTGWLRCIGRLAFPIYCFLLVEGFEHTSNVKKYMMRLGVFALISEIPFDLAFSRSWFYIGYQNVYFTLFLGLAAMYFGEIMACRMPKYGEILRYVPFVAAAVLAQILDTDYHAAGIIIILGFYAFKHMKVYLMIFEALVFYNMNCTELCGLFAFLPIYLYNGKRGPYRKWMSTAFYAFYPVHLLILALLKYFIR